MNGHSESRQRKEPAGHGLGPSQTVELGQWLMRMQYATKKKQAIRRAKKLRKG